jgi:hypothetical protein
VYFVLLAAAVAILAGVVAVAMGWGGELAISRRDLPVIPPRIRTASDVARLRLPLGLFGYQAESADEVLDALATQLAERDAEIARLREEVRWLGTQRSGSAGGAAPTVAGPRATAVPPFAAEPPPAAVPPAAESPGTELPDIQPSGAESAHTGSSRPESAGPGSADSGDGEVLSAPGLAGGQSSPPT